MQYVTKKCPHCGHTYTFMHAGSDTSFGSPIMTCEKCGKLFIDKDRKEIAIEGITKEDIPVHSGNTIAAVMFLSIFEPVVLYYLFYDGIDQYWWLSIVLTLFLIFSWLQYYAEKASYSTRLKEFEIAKMESEGRVSNVHYAMLLKNLGYDVPEKYLNSNCENNVEKEVK